MIIICISVCLLKFCFEVIVIRVDEVLLVLFDCNVKRNIFDDVICVFSEVRTIMRRVSRVLFDMDGLLLDTENLYTEGTQQILDMFGHTYDWDFKSKLMGKRTDEVARMIVDNYKIPLTPEEWIMKSKEKYNSLFPHVKSLPGVMKLVHHLSKNGVLIAVASSSSTSAFKIKTQNHAGLFSMFDAIVLGDDPRVKNAKPAPDIFLTAAEQLRQLDSSGNCDKVEDSLVVEDAPLGVEAGRAAGMPVLMVPHPKLAEDETKAASKVVKTLTSFDPRDFGLPGYRYTRVDHIIFDMDGLLLNTQDMYSQVGQAMLAKHGKEPDYEFKMKVVGRAAPEAAKMIVEHYGLPYTPEDYLAAFEAQTAELFPTCDLLPGVERLLRHFHCHNIPMAVATSSSRKNFELKTSTKHSEIFSLFSHIVTGDHPEVRGEAKPSPRIYEIARSQFSASNPTCLVFEDAPNGVSAGLAAGMQVVMVPHHKVPKHFLLSATQVHNKSERNASTSLYCLPVSYYAASYYNTSRQLKNRGRVTFLSEM